MIGTFDIIRDRVFSFLPIKDLLNVAEVCQGLEQSVKRYIALHLSYNGVSVPLEMRHFGMLQDLACELELYNTRAIDARDKMLSLEQPNYRKIMLVWRIKEAFFYYLRHRKPNVHANGDVYAEDWDLLQQIDPSAQELAGNLLEGRIIQLLIHKPFPNTSAQSLRVSSAQLVKHCLKIVNIVARFVQSDERLDPLLEQGKRYWNAKTRSDLHGRILVAIEAFTQSRLGLITMARLCAYILNCAMESPGTVALRFEAAFEYLIQEQGDDFHREVLYRLARKIEL